MGKGKKREEKAADKEGDYEFKLPEFDEEAFVRREVHTARASFWTLGLGFAAGIVAIAGSFVEADWSIWIGWGAIALSMLALGPMLQRAGFPEDVVKPKALVGSYFMLFFTGLGLWILGVNFV